MATATRSTTPHRPSAYRQFQAQQTRDRIADAARRLFAVHGYSSTSMDAIASEAGVANRTVYAAFGAKREILASICEQWLEQADARDAAKTAIAEPSARARLRAAARWLRSLYEAGFDVMTIIESASDEDEETRAVLRAKLVERNRAMDAIIASLDGQLRRPTAEAQAIYRAFATPGVYRELVIETGWSHDDFEAWLADTLIRQLLQTRRSSAHT
jgi:AcrR family transcriptional regulator